MKNFFNILVIMLILCGCTKKVYLEAIPCVEGCQEPVCVEPAPVVQRYQIYDINESNVTYVHKNDTIIRCTQNCK